MIGRMGLTVTRTDPLTDPAWDSFVESHSEATAYHLSAWARILSRSYRFRPVYLRAHDSRGSMTGAMPLMAKWGPVSGRRLRSLPVVPTGGPLADDEDGLLALLERACGLAEEGGHELVVESRSAGLERAHADIVTFPRPPSWVLELPGDDEEWLRARSKNLARSIKKAESSGLTVRLGEAEDDLRRFYRLYLATMRGHRSLPRLYRQLRMARELLWGAGVFRLFIVELEGRIAAGGVFHVFRDTMELLYNASDSALLRLRPNHALYRHVIRWSSERGLRRLDFGFAWPASPLGTFKAQWGAAPVPEYGYAYGPGSRGPSAGRASPAREQPNGSARRLLSRTWGKAPLPLTRLAATVAYRYL